MAKKECQLHGDRMQIGPDRGDGLHPCVRHTPDHKISPGWVKPLKQGKPLNGASVVYLQYDPSIGDFEVKSTYEPNQPKDMSTKTQASPSTGPAMVASDEYRSGWDRIFGQKAAVGEA
jgi:hypothetical protein